MVLARDINLHISTSYNPPLLTRGQALTDAYIRKISLYNVGGVYIESTLPDEIEPREGINQRLKGRALRDIKSIFRDFKTNKYVLGRGQMQRLIGLSKDLVYDILSKDCYITDISGLRGYDDYTYHHSLYVSVLSIATGVSLGFPEGVLHEIALSGLLHDIGKMAIPIEIINKPGSLTEKEFEIIKSHPSNAVEFLRDRNDLSASVISGIEHHHERYSGGGYPHGLKGEQIPLYARILAVCDVYDALTSNRPYKKQSFPSEAIEYMMGAADVQFDYNILVAFLKNVAAYPVGTFVALSNGETGVVIRNHSEAILRPIVRLLDGGGHSGGRIDLLTDPHYANVTIVDRGYKEHRLSLIKLSAPPREEVSL